MKPWGYYLDASDIHLPRMAAILEQLENLPADSQLLPALKEEYRSLCQSSEVRELVEKTVDENCV